LILDFLLQGHSANCIFIFCMLRELSIRNFAIIDDLRIDFGDGLTILSGETGAGKSVIINAVNLLLGGRAATSLIRTGADNAELEALFEIKPGSNVAEIMREHGYNSGEGLLIRRIISNSDRHRIYINDRLSTIQVLNAVTENLASISGQHAHQGFLKEDQQLLILDQFGGLMPLRAEVCRCFHELVPLVRMLRDLNENRDRQAEHIELLKFQKKEIIDASIVPGEDQALDQERMRLKNAEALYQEVNKGIEEIYSSEGAVVERLFEVKKSLDKASQIDPELCSKAESIGDAAFHLEDIAGNLRAYLNRIQIDDKRLETVEARLDLLHRLKRKYGRSLEAVFSTLESIDHQLSGIENISERAIETEVKISKLHEKLAGLSMQLSLKRKQTSEILSEKVMEELSTLEMSQTKLQISLQPCPMGKDTDSHLITEGTAINETGIDSATFLIAPNVGEPLKPLANIVSGGELSRVVLALKAILAKSESVETSVFDEVDAGIGGSVAEVVGRKLSSLAAYHQVICITHLPQIAKFGDYHFSISKQVSRGRTITRIKALNEKERVEEIARMLGGTTITQATIEHAREMLQDAK
jgi:DNA repair protein RecN (Recombination protein N)